MNSIGIFSFAKFQAFLFSLVGLLAGILYSFGGLIIDTMVSLNLMTSEETAGLGYGTILAFMALIGMPLIFGIIGLLAGILEAFLYNTVVKWFSIFKMDFEHN